MSTVDKPIRLTVTDVAERLNISTAKVRMMVQNGELTAIDVTAKPGATRPRLRIDLEEVQRFERARSTRPVVTPTRSRPIARPRKQWV